MLDELWTSYGLYKPCTNVQSMHTAGPLLRTIGNAFRVHCELPCKPLPSRLGLVPLQYHYKYVTLDSNITHIMTALTAVGQVSVLDVC